MANVIRSVLPNIVGDMEATYHVMNEVIGSGCRGEAWSRGQSRSERLPGTGRHLASGVTRIGDSH